MYTGMILENSLYRNRKLISFEELMLRREAGEPLQIIDVRSQRDYDKGHIEGALHIPLGEIRGRLNEISKGIPVIVHCNKGVSGNAAQNILLNFGFEAVFNLSGGFSHFSSEFQSR